VEWFSRGLRRNEHFLEVPAEPLDAVCPGVLSALLASERAFGGGGGDGEQGDGGNGGDGNDTAAASFADEAAPPLDADLAAVGAATAAAAAAVESAPPLEADPAGIAAAQAAFVRDRLRMEVHFFYFFCFFYFC